MKGFILSSICIVFAFIFQFTSVKSEEEVINSIEKKNQKDVISLTTPYPSVPELIQKEGYPCEIHHVVTDDNYILTIHRVPDGRKPKRNGKQKKALFLQHGLLSSSGSWILNSPDRAPAYVFADLGYDVWIGNFRGSVYSRNHSTYDVHSKDFWQFSWDEMAYYDLPAMIDYVLLNTNHMTLYYIGHSMGTTTFFALMSERPKYNSKIQTMIGLAPVSHVSHIQTPLRYLSYLQTFITATLEGLHQWEFLPEDSCASRIIRRICELTHISELTCTNALFFITGFDRKEFNETWFDEISKTLLSGTSLYTVMHYAQEYTAGKFQHYDYGKSKNMEIYGKLTPPLYNLSRVTAPVFILYGKNDYLADVKDVKTLASQLPNLVSVQAVKNDLFNHLDFLMAIDERRLVLDPVVKYLKSFG